MKKPSATEFGSDWSRQKLLCYDVREAVVASLGYLELIAEHNVDGEASEKALKGALKNTQFAARKVAELFQEICNTEKGQ